MSKATIIRIVLVFGALFILFRYYEKLVKRPQSIHYWRQTDCASLTLNYYQNGMHFFEPEVHHLSSDDLTTGYGVGEFPIFYYFIALLYHIFGYHEIIYRIVNTLIFFLGLLYLFKLSYKNLSDFFWSSVPVLFLMCSPVLVYYGNNFLTDSTAFSIALIAWYFFFLFTATKKSKFLNISILIFLLASLLKITAGMSLIVIFILFIAGIVKMPLFHVKESEVKKKLVPALLFGFSFLVIAGWYFYAIYYNKVHNTTYFSTRTWPLWDLSSEEIAQIYHSIKSLWFKEYFNVSMFYMMIIESIFVLINIRKNRKIFNIILLFLFIGTALYSLLWFFAFKEHDYYIINILMLPLFLLITCIDTMKRHFGKLFKSILFKIAITIFIAFNLTYTVRALHNRYNGWMNEYFKYKYVHEITPYLRSLGIDRNDKVICCPDQSHNYTLYLMNQRGWTDLYGLTSSSDNMEKAIQKGASYLILVDENDVFGNKSFMREFAYHKIGEYGNVTIYKLDGIVDNTFEKNKKIISSFLVDIETIDSVSGKILSDNRILAFDGVTSLCRDVKYSGNQSVKIDINNQYSLTGNLPVKENETYEISIMKKGGNEGMLVVTDKSGKKVYLTSNRSDQCDSLGWCELKIKCMIPENMNDDNLIIYTYNPSDQPCYFDDLKIVQFENLITSF
jgi:hypothetical protein